MTKEEMIELWNTMFHSKNAIKKYIPMAIGRHDNVGDGWRRLILNKENIIVTIERNPLGYFIYCGDYRFELGDNQQSEQMCIDFNNREEYLEKTL